MVADADWRWYNQYYRHEFFWYCKSVESVLQIFGRSSIVRGHKRNANNDFDVNIQCEWCTNELLFVLTIVSTKKLL